MKSFIAALRSLVLPFGATSGARIVLDGVNGRIQVFNAAGVQVGILDGITGFQFTGSLETFRVQADGNVFIREVPDNGAYLQLTAAAGFGGLIFFQPENSTVAGLVFFPAAMYADAIESGGVNSQPKLQITSPYVTGTPNKANAQLVLKGQTNTSATDDSSVDLDAGQVNMIADQIKVNGVNNGRGWIDGDGAAASKGPFGVTETIVLVTGQKTWKANRAYQVVVSACVSLSANPNKPNIKIRQSSDGTTNLGTEIYNAARTISGGGNQAIDFTCKFKVGAADVTCFIVMALQGSAAFDVTLIAPSPASMFDVYEIGDASNHSHAVTIT